MLRGGPQDIPRPQQWLPGPPAPWQVSSGGAVPATDLESIERRLGLHVPGSRLTGAPPPRKMSAVMVPLYAVDDDVVVVLTRRGWHMRSHRGEVSFPGGGQDPGETLWETALREANEEVALDRATARRIGQLDRLRTVSSNAQIVPFVAALDGVPELSANPDEVDAVLHVRLSELMHEECYREEHWIVPGSAAPRPVFFFDLVGDTIWGATAAMLRQLLCVASGVAPD